MIANDPYPAEVDCAIRGRSADVPVVTVEDTAAYDESSVECARELHRAVFEHLDGTLAEIGPVYPDSADRGTEGVHVSYGGWDAVGGTYVQVWYKDRFRDEDRPDEFDALVNLTPHSAEIHSTNGDEICMLPVYVELVDRSGTVP